MFSDLPIEHIAVTQRMLGNYGQLAGMVKTIRDGKARDLPPIILNETSDNFLQCRDGHHRLLAFYLAGERVLQIENYLYSVGSLRQHSFGSVETLVDWLAEYERLHNVAEPLCPKIQ